MSLIFPTQTSIRHRRRHTRSHLVPIVVGASLAFGAIAMVGYLLWPTWQSARAEDPGRIPVSVGGALFNVPTHAFRRKVQKHSGPQERIDLSYAYPSLEATDVPRHISVETFDDTPQPIDRIFLSISAHHDAMSPETRLRTIYPRYSDQVMAAQDGLTTRPFRDATPYSHEDLFVGDEPALVARCSRDTTTPGMCLSERRINGADLSFRFPRAWLSQWREVGEAMDRLTAQLVSPRG
ncbi:hypothetical protein [Tardiphaga sp.]|uniref:hypothetical protein n=1 Tax=Tardiphaga sp. TaxID=1926292 RepID=UPI0026191346|nr:hypothetical protein [Tardiphaga sp.]